ncbi:MAG: cyclic nucleotide-binding/CBS domain-containing protein, partial [bacterium]
GEQDITFSDERLKVPIKSLSLNKVLVVEAGTPVKKSIDLMVARKIGCVLIVKSHELYGIFTERDLLFKIAGENLDLVNSKIDDFMTPSPVALKMNDTIVTALRLMHHGGYRHMPVVDKQNLPVAVVSIKDILNYIVEYFPQDVLNLPPHPIRIGTKNREGG